MLEFSPTSVLLDLMWNFFINGPLTLAGEDWLSGFILRNLVLSLRISEATRLVNPVLPYVKTVFKTESSLGLPIIIDNKIQCVWYLPPKRCVQSKSYRLSRQGGLMALLEVSGHLSSPTRSGCWRTVSAWRTVGAFQSWCACRFLNALVFCLASVFVVVFIHEQGEFLRNTQSLFGTLFQPWSVLLRGQDLSLPLA